jgi:hypothetical protein
MITAIESNVELHHYSKIPIAFDPHDVVRRLVYGLIRSEAKKTFTL